MRPRFTSHDDAWRSFTAGGALVPLDEQRASLTAGRAQLLNFQAPAATREVGDAAASLLDALDDIDGILPMADDLLHCSLGALGFQVIEPRRPDDVTREQVGVAARAAAALRGIGAVDVRVGPVNVFPEALVLEVHGGDALAQLYRAIAVARGVDLSPDDEATFLPHITIAWFTSAGIAPELRQRLPALRDIAPVPLRIARVELARWWFTGEDSAEVEMDVVRSYRLR
jgi:2'-5' RNA ligase